MGIGRLLSAFVFCLFALCSFAQNKIEGTVVDRCSHEPLVGAVIHLQGSGKALAVTDINGRFSVSIPNGAKIKITYVGYRTLVAAGHNGTYRMTSTVHKINDVVVTATESNNLTSTSLIGRQAIDHLQPSSFADLLELLPGGRAHDPNLSTPHTIRLREATEVGTGGSNYDTSALGTSFVVDGAPISTNGNMQYLSSGGNKRSFLNAGVDMRSIATDDIENVEIVRGIPSVEYGDLTSGLVKIQRKRGGNNLSARLKADMGSYLFYIGKSFEWSNNLTLNVNMDYLNSHSDPRNTLENYKRVTFSTRLSKGWTTGKTDTRLSANIDYTGSFDNDKTDPDLNQGVVDTYKQSYNRYAFMLGYNLRMKSRKSFFKLFSATLSGSLDNDLTQREKLVQLRQATIAATTLRTGESDAVILPYTYMAKHRAEGKPLNMFGKLNAKFQIPSRAISNTLLLGANWNMDKNYGHGQVFDMTRPIDPGGMSGRPRDLKDIPANHTLSLYAEENIHFDLAGNTFELMAGVRGGSLIHLSDDYYMHGKIYWDPRANARWTFPTFKMLGKESFVRVAGGVGQHTKFPTIEQLYPEKNYMDIVELNYYNTNEDLKRIYLMTYVIDPTNRDLRPARNLKWEVSLDFNVGENRLSVSYFREDMKSGFRSMTVYHPYDYRLFDASGVPRDITAPPSIEDMPYTEKRELMAYSNYSNGSRTKKEGIEYTFATQRFEAIHTRLTINGAWFRTTYHNSKPTQDRPVEAVGNERIPYVGIYEDDEGFTNQQFNTNFTFDTDIPVLKLGFSISSQWLWFTMNQRNYLSEYPNEYMDRDGVVRPWDNSLEEDFQLRYLVRNYTPSMYELHRIPLSMNLNLKVTKKLFDDRLMVAMFCNRIWDYTPDYVREGVTIRRHVVPYFGLEMNLRL